jgi:hypothetical protein
MNIKIDEKTEINEFADLAKCIKETSSLLLNSRFIFIRCGGIISMLSCDTHSDVKGLKPCKSYRYRCYVRTRFAL